MHNSTRRSCLYELLYFCPLRTLGSHKQLLRIGLTLLLLVFLTPVAVNHYSSLSSTNALACAWAGIAGFVGVYFLYRFCWPYRGTGMMLVGEGKGMWSIHMAPHLSLLPFMYAGTPNRFMEAGTEKILRAAIASRPNGIILLETHLLGDQKHRRDEASRLAAALPSMQIGEGQSRRNVAWYDAHMLNAHKAALMKRVDKPFTNPIRAGDPIGMIVVRIPA